MSVDGVVLLCTDDFVFVFSLFPLFVLQIWQTFLISSRQLLVYKPKTIMDFTLTAGKQQQLNTLVVKLVITFLSE